MVLCDACMEMNAYRAATTALATRLSECSFKQVRDSELRAKLRVMQTAAIDKMGEAETAAEDFYKEVNSAA